MFAAKNPFEDIVVKATSEELTSENWELNLEVCDKVSSGGESSARNCVAAIQKRLVHRNANVQLYALTLADAVVKNCGLSAHQEIASRSFTQTLARICLDRTTHLTVKKRCTSLVKEWAGEFDDESLGLMKETYDSLKSQNVGVEEPPQQPKPEPSSEQLRAEDEELRRALELSIKDQGGRSNWTGYGTGAGEGSSSSAPIQSTSQQPAQTSTSSAYAPTASVVSFAAAPQSSIASPPVQQNGPSPSVASRVRALYDFSPTEPGELAFARGDIIRVLDSVYEHWWRGEIRGEAGIFPVNYVEILPDPTPEELQREAELEARIFSQAANIDRLLGKLRSLDPARDNLAEDEELQELYQTSLAMRPKIVKLIDRYSNKITELKSMNDKFVRARGTFDEMMEQSLSRYNPGGQSSQDYLRPRPEFHQQPSPGSAEYGQQYGYNGPQMHGSQQQSVVSHAAQEAHPSAYLQYNYAPGPSASGPSDANYGAPQQQLQPSSSSGTYGHPPSQEPPYGNAPHDDEKRRLFERARAESEAFQQQHFTQTQMNQMPPESYPLAPGTYAPADYPQSGLAQQIGDMSIGGGPSGSSYPAHPVGH